MSENYEELRDSLICDKNDSIDNASYCLGCAVATGKPAAYKEDAVKSLAKALLPDGVELPDTFDTAKALEKVEAKVNGLDIEKGENDPAWDIAWIEEITEMMEGLLDEAGIPVCHPFFTDDDESEDYDEDNDGVLCCRSCEKCDNCPKAADED